MHEPEPKTAKTFKGRGLKSEWNMTVYHFERYDKLLKMADVYGIQFRSGNLAVMNDYYATLEALYMNLKPILLNDKLRDGFEKIFTSLAENINQVRIDSATAKTSIGIDSKFFQRLKDAHMDILLAWQMLGMGVIVKSDMSAQNQLANLMGLTKK